MVRGMARYMRLAMDRVLALDLLRTVWDDGGIGAWANRKPGSSREDARREAFRRELGAMQAGQSPARVAAVEAALRVDPEGVHIRLMTNSAGPLLVLALLALPACRAILRECAGCGDFYLARGGFRRNRFCGDRCRSRSRPRSASASYMRAWRQARKVLRKD